MSTHTSRLSDYDEMSTEPSHTNPKYESYGGVEVNYPALKNGVYTAKI